MNFPPSPQQGSLVRGDKLEGATYIAALHAFRPDQLRSTIWPDQVDLGVAVTEHVNMRRRVVVRKDSSLSGQLR
jgi:hypothetical protein